MKLQEKSATVKIVVTATKNHKKSTTITITKAKTATTITNY